MTTLTHHDLDAYVDCVDRNGGSWEAPEVRQIIDNFGYAYAAEIDKSADPFSQRYYDSQIRLYEELAGRPLDQQTGEQAPVAVQALSAAANPMGIDDVGHLAENVRAVSALLKHCGLPPAARVLDLGCGAGLSTEVYAYCGARVTAVDINPAHVDLVRQRSAARNYAVSAHTLGYDHLGDLAPAAFDAALFFQSFHHAVKPWELIAALKNILEPTGVIGYTGEPVQDVWWPAWGLRLDHESVYVARKFGWFENGWSQRFIATCFARNGYELRTIHDHGHGDGAIGVAYRTDNAKAPPMPATAGELNRGKSCYSSIGTRTLVAGKPGHVSDGSRAGFLCYGPYVFLPPGPYTAFFLMRAPRSDQPSPSLSVDVVSHNGQQVHAHRQLRLSDDGRHELVALDFSLAQETSGIETRVRLEDAGRVECADPWLDAAR